jgi:murein L,D-transpeptidase YafK
VAVAKDPTTAEKAEANRSVMAAVKRWADAWSKQDPDAYIAMYAPTFKPKDMTRAQWEAYRRDRLTKPKSIRIELSDQKAIMLSAQKMRVTFTQQYMSDSLKTSDKKTLELELIDNQWRITLESGR